MGVFIFMQQRFGIRANRHSIDSPVKRSECPRSVLLGYIRALSYIQFVLVTRYLSQRCRVFALELSCKPVDELIFVELTLCRVCRSGFRFLALQRSDNFGNACLVIFNRPRSTDAYFASDLVGTR